MNVKYELLNELEMWKKHLKTMACFWCTCTLVWPRPQWWNCMRAQTLII